MNRSGTRTSARVVVSIVVKHRCTPKCGRETRASSPHKFTVCVGQVGQESNLQPAVLEVAALRPRQSYTGPYCHIIPNRFM
jgi:hypothetical protein